MNYICFSVFCFNIYVCNDNNNKNDNNDNNNINNNHNNKYTHYHCIPYTIYIYTNIYHIYTNIYK